MKSFRELWSRLAAKAAGLPPFGPPSFVPSPFANLRSSSSAWLAASNGWPLHLVLLSDASTGPDYRILGICRMTELAFQRTLAGYPVWVFRAVDNAGNPQRDEGLDVYHAVHWAAPDGVPVSADPR